MLTPSRTSAAARRCARLLAGTLLLGGLLACGYKGPLYLPEPEAPATELTTPPGHDTPSATPAQ